MQPAENHDSHHQHGRNYGETLDILGLIGIGEQLPYSLLISLYIGVLWAKEHTDP